MNLYDMNDTNFDNYQNFILDNADLSEVTICNGDTLLEAAENSYLLEEFMASPSYVAWPTLVFGSRLRVAFSKEVWDNSYLIDW